MSRKTKQGKVESDAAPTENQATGRRAGGALQLRGGGTGGGGKTRGGAQASGSGEQSPGGRPPKNADQQRNAALGRGRSGTTSGGGRASARTRSIKQDK
jgi:hypothetical protein